MRRNKLFAEACKNAGLDLTKDYFILSGSEIAKLDEIRKAFHYSGTNYLGRSKTRQFWYACKKGV